MPHPCSRILELFAADCALAAPTLKCGHMKKTKQQFFYVKTRDDIVMMCHDCAVCEAAASECSIDECYRCASMFFMYVLMRGASGNAPNYFIVSACEEHSRDVPEGSWGVKLLKFVAAREFSVEFMFMNVRQVTTRTFPEPYVKVKKRTPRTTTLPGAGRNPLGLEVA